MSSENVAFSPPRSLSQAVSTASTTLCEQHSRHNWTPSQKQALKILVETYEIPWSLITPVFNTFVQDISNANIVKGLSRGKLTSQYSDLKRFPSRVESSCQDGLHAPFKEESEVESHLEAIASRLGIPLIKNERSSVVESSTPYVCTRKRSQTTSDDLANDMPLIVDADTPMAIRPKRQRTLAFPRTPSSRIISRLESEPLTPPSSKSALSMDQALSWFNGETSPSLMTKKRPNFRFGSSDARSCYQLGVGKTVTADIPFFGFRGFSEASQGVNGANGFRAGAFVDATRIKECPAQDSTEFREEATFHVGWTRDRPSPFISITTSPIRAMMRARAPKHKGRWIAVLDLHYIKENGALFEARKLALSPKRADGSQIDYQPGGEFLVWGQLPKNAICKILSIDDLVAFKPSIPNDPDPLCLDFITTAWRRVATRAHIAKNNGGPLLLSFYAGVAVGKMCQLLLPTSPIDMVSCILTDWSFRLRGQAWEDNHIFCQGLRLGIKNQGIEIGEDHGEIIDLTGEDDSVLSMVQQLQKSGLEEEGSDLEDYIMVKDEVVENDHYSTNELGTTLHPLWATGGQYLDSSSQLDWDTSDSPLCVHVDASFTDNQEAQDLTEGMIKMESSTNIPPKSSPSAWPTWAGM